MIYVKLIGRLGNQLFYYSIAREIQVHHPEYGEIYFIPENKNYDQYGGVTLQEFNVKYGGVIERPNLSIIQKTIDATFKINRKLLGQVNKTYEDDYTLRKQAFLNKHGLYCMKSSLFYNLQYGKYNNIYISGVWENPRYFEDIKELLQEEIVPSKPINIYNRDLLYKIQNTNSVCLSIRRGDFLKPENKNFNICTKEYFDSAVNELNKHVENMTIFVFSDDINWCKKNIKYPFPTYFENNGGNDTVSEKLRLMTNCKYFIIPNSTFSWWSQYLCKNNEKIVIAPRPWRKNEYCDCLYDSSFILLNASTGRIEQ